MFEVIIVLLVIGEMGGNVMLICNVIFIYLEVIFVMWKVDGFKVDV